MINIIMIIFIIITIFEPFIFIIPFIIWILPLPITRIFNAESRGKKGVCLLEDVSEMTAQICCMKVFYLREIFGGMIMEKSHQFLIGKIYPRIFNFVMTDSGNLLGGFLCG